MWAQVFMVAVSSWPTELSFQDSSGIWQERHMAMCGSACLNLLSTQGAEAGRSLHYTLVWSTELDPEQPGLHRETLFQKTKKCGSTEVMLCLFAQSCKLGFGWKYYIVWNLKLLVKLQKAYWMACVQRSGRLSPCSYHALWSLSCVGGSQAS